MNKKKRNTKIEYEIGKEQENNRHTSGGTKSHVIVRHEFHNNKY